MSLRSVLVATVAVCVAASVVSAAPADFVRLENQLSTALAHYDVKTVAALWDDDFVSVFPNGQLSRKVDRIAGLTPPAASADTTLTSSNDAVDVQYQDDRIAVVTVRSTWRAGAKNAGEAYVATHVWIRRGGQWRLLRAQIARVKPG